MTPFTFGKEYRPDMMHDEANVLSQMDKFGIGIRLKVNEQDSVFEHWYARLLEIKSEKAMTVEKIGK